jgi:MoaA/NifB/PqqE/SkfB family radical SAM enzyme
MISFRTLTVAAKRALNEVRTGLSLRAGRPFCKPSMVYLQVTDKCNSRCVMCGTWRDSDKVEHIPLETLKRRIDELHAWLGRAHIQLGTGEPFMHPQMLEVVQYGNSKGMLMGTVTNALMIGDKLAEGIIRSGFFNINISLDGVRPETHALTRGIPTAHQRVVEAIDRLVHYRKRYNAGTRIMLKPIIFRDNVDQLVPLAEFARNKGLDGINFQPIQRNNSACEELMRIDDPGALRETFEQLKRMRREGYPILNTDREFDAFHQYFLDPKSRPALLSGNCSVGYSNLWVMDGGVVHLCMAMQMPIGHVDELGGFRRLWRSPEAAQVRKAIAACRRPCLASCLIKRTLPEQFNRFRTFMRKK